MMKDTKTEKNKLRRYLDDMYIREEASQLLESMRDADYKDILDELSAEVWEESVSQQPVTDLEREKYKKEARQLLKHIEHKKRTWFRRVMTIAASVAAVIAIVTGSISYFRYMSEQQITFAEISTSFGEKKRVELPDGTILVLNSCSQVRYPDSFKGISGKWNWKEKDISGLPIMKICRLLYRRSDWMFVFWEPGLM